MRKINKMKNYPVCPLCKGYIPNNDTPGEYPGALSRVDNTTEICSECGVMEALADYARSQNNPNVLD